MLSLNTKGGTSDARHFAEFGVDTIEFGVIKTTAYTLKIASERR